MLRTLPIIIHHVPEEGVKRRAVSPLKLTLDLALPNKDLSTYDLVGTWSKLRLPAGSSLRKATKHDLLNAQGKCDFVMALSSISIFTKQFLTMCK